MRKLNPMIQCRDGFEISVQSHKDSYSQRDEFGKLLSVECGFPNEKPTTKRLQEFAELCGTDDYTKTVYPYTPIEVIKAELEFHGGIYDGCLPE